MIKLTRLNGDPIVVNAAQIMIIDSIPESKIVFMNKEFFIVKESPEEIIRKTAEYHMRVLTSLPPQTKRSMQYSSGTYELSKEDKNG